MKHGYMLIMKREYTNTMTGEPVPDYDPGTQSMGGTISVNVTPDSTAFMSLAHVLLAMVIGYAGGKFALWVHQRPPTPKTGDEQSDEPEPV